MTKKDFELIAVAINRAIEETKNGIADNSNYMSEVEMEAYNHAIFGIGQAVNQLCDTLKKDNARFDAKKFIKACGI